MSAFAITPVQDALRDWLLLSTGLAESAVIWADQSGGSPAGAFATLRLSSILTLSPHDDSRHDFSDARPEGEEIERAVWGPRELVVGVQTYSPRVVGATSAFELARKAQTGLQRTDVRQALASAGLALIDAGAPRNVSTLLDTAFQGRMAFDVRFNASDEAVTRLTYIETASGEGTVLGADLPPQPYSVTLPPEEF